MPRATPTIDALVFTAGIGEHAPEIRRRVCERTAWLEIELDRAVNEAASPRLTQTRSRVSVWTIRTDENLMIARHTRKLVEIASESKATQ